MLQLTNGAITETLSATTLTTTAMSSNASSNWITEGCYQNPTVYWQSYPVYVCSDKTKKAIEVLKALQAEKLLKCESVPRFIELVEKISGLL